MRHSTLQRRALQSAFFWCLCRRRCKDLSRLCSTRRVEPSLELFSTQSSPDNWHMRGVDLHSVLSGKCPGLFPLPSLPPPLNPSPVRSLVTALGTCCRWGRLSENVAGDRVLPVAFPAPPPEFLTKDESRIL